METEEVIDIRTEKLEPSGPCSLMEMYQQGPRNSAHLLYIASFVIYSTNRRRRGTSQPGYEVSVGGWEEQADAGSFYTLSTSVLEQERPCPSFEPAWGKPCFPVHLRLSGSLTWPSSSQQNTFTQDFTPHRIVCVCVFINNLKICIIMDLTFYENLQNSELDSLLRYRTNRNSLQFSVLIYVTYSV